MTAVPVYSGMTVDNSTIVLGTNNNMQVSGSNPNAAQTVVNGTAGSYTWSQPVQGTSWKAVIIYFSGYSNVSTSAIVFPVAFTVTPLISNNATGLSISTISASGLTIPISTLQTGFMILQGY